MKHAIPGLLVMLGCGGAAAEAPLTVALGTDRDGLGGALRRHEYCLDDTPPTGAETTELIEKCDVPGAEHGQSWVIAAYGPDGRVVRVQRWERYPEDARTLARFNQLIEKRGGPDDAAKAALAAQQELPAGTKTWVAFAQGPDALVGVYLLEPRPPQYATILEEIVERRR